MSDFVALKYELGQTERTIELLSFKPDKDFADKDWLALGVNGRRVSLVATGVYMIQAFWALKSGSSFADAEPLLDRAKRIYKCLEKIYLGLQDSGIAASIRHLSVQISLSMITYIKYRFIVPDSEAPLCY